MTDLVIGPLRGVDDEVGYLLRDIATTMEILETFEEPKRSKLLDGLESIIRRLRHLRAMASGVSASVPGAALRYCEEGKCLDEVARAVLSGWQEATGRSRLKQSFMAAFGQSLNEEMAQHKHVAGRSSRP